MPTIKLSLNKIREFISFADKIQSAKSIEILSTKDYIKLEIVMEEVFLTKHNIYAFVKHSFAAPQQDDTENGGILINEKILDGYVSSCLTSSKWLYISFDSSGGEKMNISISDNEKMKNKQSFSYNVSSIDIKNFPSDRSGMVAGMQKTRILEDVLSSINIAKGFVSKDNNDGKFCSLYIVDNSIYASDRYTFYYKKLNHTKLPFIAIGLEECKILCGGAAEMKFIDYVVTESHNLFFKGNTIFGFRHFEGMTGYDYKFFFDNFNENNFRVRVEDLLLFCNRTKNISSLGDSKFIPSRCTVIDNEAVFKYVDDDFGSMNINEVQIIEKNGTIEPFSLNHGLWYDLLKPIPYSEIIINHNSKMPFISITSIEDKEFYAVVSKVNI